MTAIVPKKTSVSFGVVSELTVGGETVNLILEKIQDRGVTVFQGGMVTGQRLLVVALLADLIPELDAPDSIQNLAITKLAVELRPDKGAFSFEGVIENAWSITLDSGPTLSIDSLALSVLSVNPANGSTGKTTEALSQQRKVAFEGIFSLFGGNFTVQVAHQFYSPKAGISGSQWGFLAIAENISITEVIKAFGFSQDNLNDYGLSSVVVNLAFRLQQNSYREGNIQKVESSYTFRGELDWDTEISLASGGETLQIQAAVEISKVSQGQNTTLQGFIGGTVKASIPFFDTLQLSVIYTFTRATSGNSSSALARRSSGLVFQLQVGTLILRAVYTNTNNRKLLRFTVGLVDGDNPTIGDLVAYIVSLYDPSISNFELDPPWDELTNQTIALNKFSLEVDLTQKTVTISYRATLNVLIAKVSNIGLSYQFGTSSSQVSAPRNQTRTASNKKVAIAVDLSIPGQPKKRVQWDPVNENPPAVPGTKAPIFELKFLALGQRVAFAPEIVRQARTIEQVTNVMRQTLVPLPPIKRRQNPLTALQQSLPSAVSSDPSQPIQFSSEPIIFSAESGWLIGAQFTILGAIDLSVIFNDPFIYGLRISLSGPLVQVFSGLEFEILYRRISDTVGVYRTELTLPDAMRNLQFGVVSITLPVVAIEVYTNGDFGVDVGFPWGGDFSRSIAVNVLIFLGVGGFYFNKLSAETATSVPVITNGKFDPVLEFGIGLKVGLGKILQKGPLRAEISITMHGILQGVFATFNPTDTSQGKVTYYRVQGGVAIVGRIYGTVDFKVIQVDVEVVAKVAVLFVVEVYKAIQVALVATVSVKASIKIVFVRIRFKFNLTVREEFVLGSDSTPPWKLVASAGAMTAKIPGFAANNRVRMRRNIRGNFTVNPSAVSNVGTVKRSLRWDDGSTGVKLALPTLLPTESKEGDKLRLDIYFQPAFTKTATGVRGISLLFMENSLPLNDDSGNPQDNDTDFDELVKALFKWVIYAYLTDTERSAFVNSDGSVSLDSQVLSLALLEDIYNLFIQCLEEESADALWLPLIRFLSANFVFDITDRPVNENDIISGTIFPIFPQLQMELKDGSSNVLNTVDFDAEKYSAEQIKAIQNYFRSVNPNHDGVTDEALGKTAENPGGGDLAMAELLFVDYFTLIIRSVLQLGIDYLREQKIDTISLVDLLDSLNGGESFTSLAGMTSRFLLHGLRLPTFSNGTTINGDNPVYLATKQQFTVTVTPSQTAGEDDTITPNEIRFAKPANTLPWIRFIDYTDSTNSTTSDTELNYPFSADNLSIISQLESQTTSGILPTTAPTWLDFYDTTSQQYTIRQQTEWNTSTTATNNNLLWELPLGLSDYLKGKFNPAQDTVSLFYYQQTSAGEAFDTSGSNKQDITGYTWGTKLTVEIRRVSPADGTGFLPTVYTIERFDSGSGVLLRDILTGNVTPTDLNLLYLDDTGNSKVLTRNSSAEVFILKTNLAVNSSNLAVPLDNSGNFRNFLQLLQESTIVSSGGYYLNYSYTENGEEKGLPDSLFTDGETAKVTILMTFASTPASYHNCLNIPATNSQITEIRGTENIFAESGEITILKIPAGNLGFTLTRPLIEAKDDDSARDEIENLYQLLSYDVPDSNANFTTGQNRLPMGPVEDDSKQNWVYEKVIPVYALSQATQSSNHLPAVLKTSLNPYRGIGDEFGLDFQWQDVYGNRLGEDGKFASTITQQLGYFDPIVGINQWCSVGESYTVTKKDDNTANLTLELVFDQGKYIPTPTNTLAEAQEQVKTDRATYGQVYYQVHDSNLQFKWSTSLTTTASESFSNQQRLFFTDFVDNVYRYLATLEYLKAFEYQLTSTESLQRVVEKYGVNLADLGDINSAVTGIFSNSQDIKIPVEVRVQPRNSLRAIAQKLVQNSNSSSEITAKIEEIVTSYSTTSDLLAVDTIISHNSLSYTVEIGDTFESVAISQLAIEEDALIESFLLNDVVAELATTTSLRDGVFIKGSLAENNNSCYVVLQGTLAEIAYGVLQLENTDLETNFEENLTNKINSLVAANESTVLVSGIEIESLAETIQPGDTFTTIRDRLLTQPAYSNQTPEDVLKEVAQALRELNIFPDNTTVNNQNITIKVINEKTWEAIAAAFPNTTATETANTVILANADNPDLLVENSTININNSTYTIQNQDSLLTIATSQFIVQDSRNLTVLNSGDITAELGALEYTITETDLSKSTLASLTEQLNLQTNSHRTVLATVKAVGNINTILTNQAIANQLSQLATAVGDITGLFGSEDIILEDVLFNYTVNSGDSFDEMIATATSSDSQDNQIITDFTTAGDIALQNPSLSLQANAIIQIPDRFTLDTTAAANPRELAIVTSPATATSLAALTNTMGINITPAAVAIANQSIAGILNSGEDNIDISSVLANLISLGTADMGNLNTFVTNSTLAIATEETLYTLKSRWEDIIADFQTKIDLETSVTIQNIGAVNAILEQFTFVGANRSQLRASLNPNDANSSLSILKGTLLDSQDILKPQFQPATVHNPTATLDVVTAINNIAAAYSQATDDELITILQTSLDTINRMYDLSCVKLAQDLLEKRSQNPLTTAEVATAISNLPNLVAANTQWIVPPAASSITLEMKIRNTNSNNLLYPPELRFPVTVQVTMERASTLMDENAVAEAQSISAYFSPKTISLTSSPDEENSNFSNRLASLDAFATALETALPNLKLAVGRNGANIDNANPQNSDTLWAVHLGNTGINYNINEAFPFFFSAAPLTNTLMSGTVTLYDYVTDNGLNKNSDNPTVERVDAVDINGLARIYLRAIEDTLKPETSIPATKETTFKNHLERILQVKTRLADAISKDVTHVLKTTLDTASPDYLNRREIAVSALKQEFLTNLADAYDIETIVQYNVEVNVATGYNWSNNNPVPRLSGQPVIASAKYTNETNADSALLQSLDFSLSPAKIALDDSTTNTTSNLTFFFNTQTPQRYEDIEVKLIYQVNELEYDINSQNSTSSWLNFVIPLTDENTANDTTDPNHIGYVQIPIPLRDYPLPPSLIAHQAIADPDSFSGNILSANDIRDWNYVFLYEHPDVAQDTIECRIDYNSTSQEQLLTIDDVTVSENVGNAIFTVTLFPPSENIVTVDYTTQDGSAIAPQDYTTTTGTLRFDVGETSKTISVPIVSDTILEDNEAFSIVLSNPSNATIADAEGIGTIIDAPLLDTLVRFNHLYPTLAKELQPLETTNYDSTSVANALDAFATLAEEVVNAWENWQPIAIAEASRGTIQYNIDETLQGDTKEVTIQPTANLPQQEQQILEVELPGYQLNSKKKDGVINNSPTLPYQSLGFEFSKLPDATGVETFGESALPDRKLTVANLDILDYQNAWGAIRLARNKKLIEGRETNPAFIFQTPEVRFKNRITPLIINDTKWDIGDLSQPASQTLENHLKTLFETILPPQINRPYDIRIACQYAFSLAIQDVSIGSEDELLASLPVLLTPRFTVQKSNSATIMEEVTRQLRSNIVTEMKSWWNQKKPNTSNGRYIFSFSLFSQAGTVSVTDNPNLPLLTVENLNLKFVDVSDIN